MLREVGGAVPPAGEVRRLEQPTRRTAARWRTPESALLGCPVAVVRQGHVIQVRGDKQRKLLVAINVDHDALAKRLLQPHAHRPVRGSGAHPLSIAVLLTTAYDHSDIDLVVSLVDDDLTNPSIVAAERDPKLELADVPFPKTKRMT
jgi:hypothetical protein